MVEVNNRVQVCNDQHSHCIAEPETGSVTHTRRCSTSPLLCKPGSKQTCQRVSGSGKVLVVNNSNVDQHQHIDGHKVKVYVQNKDGRPLMPCTPTKARHLLEQQKAQVVTRKPFTIRLLWDCEHHTQPLTLGVDSGYNHVGVSVVDSKNKKEVLNAEIQLRNDIPKKLLERRMYRRNRRNRKWHRPPRFDNRKREDGWLAPSIQHKLNSHLQIIRKVKQVLPITRIMVGVAGFDIQRIKNPEIQGEQYQQGEQLGFWNLREYVLHRDNHTCQHCHGKKKDPILQVHHLRGRMDGGATNRPDELITVCKTCHEDHHQGKDIIPTDKKIKSFKSETFMTTVRWKLVNIVREKFPGIAIGHTFGHITKAKRIRNGLVKSHGNDAFVIAGGNGEMSRVNTVLSGQRRRNNRSLQKNRKGFKPSIRKQRYGLQPSDLVLFDGLIRWVKGVHCHGSRVLLDMGKSVALKNVELICYGKGLFC